MFAQGGLFNFYGVKCLGMFHTGYTLVPEGGNEGGRVVTPTSISIFDSYDLKTL